MMHLRANSFNRWFEYIVMGALCAFGAFFLVVTMFELMPMKDPADKIPMRVFVVLWNLVVYWTTYTHLKIPIGIFVNDAGNVVFRSFVGSLSVLSPSQITKLGYGDEGWILYHLQGNLDLRYFRRKDMKRLYRWLALTNPHVNVPDSLRPI